MKITLEIDDKHVALALQTAQESGVGYWASELGQQHGAWYVIERDAKGADEGGAYSFLDIERGLRMMYHRGSGTLYTSVGKGMIPSLWDANQADAFVQYAAFGELRYG
jgi:hypothetical protein